ncbi:hypothetical protein BJV77DRAFT_1071938 [Russula vinacea]|nr:hypothetical protein BJV77DRAFT_1071938 [Russula vinacea]
MARSNSISSDSHPPFRAKKSTSGSDASTLLKEKQDWGFDDLLPGLIEKHAPESNVPPCKGDFGFDSILSSLLEGHTSGSNASPQKHDFGFDNLLPACWRSTHLMEEYRSGSDAPPQKQDFGFDSLLPGLLDEHTSASDAPPQKQDFGFDSLLPGLFKLEDLLPGLLDEAHLHPMPRLKNRTLASTAFSLACWRSTNWFDGPPQKEDFGFNSLPPCLLKRINMGLTESPPTQKNVPSIRMKNIQTSIWPALPKTILTSHESHDCPSQDDFKVNIPEVLKNFDPNADIFPLHEEYLRILMSSSPQEGHGSSPETSCLDENTNNQWDLGQPAPLSPGSIGGSMETESKQPCCTTMRLASYEEIQSGNGDSLCHPLAASAA